jgi:hypothetical protein
MGKIPSRRTFCRQYVRERSRIHREHGNFLLNFFMMVGAREQKRFIETIFFVFMYVCVFIFIMRTGYIKDFTQLLFESAINLVLQVLSRRQRLSQHAAKTAASVHTSLTHNRSLYSTQKIPMLKCNVIFRMTKQLTKKNETSSEIYTNGRTCTPLCPVSPPMTAESPPALLLLAPAPAASADAPLVSLRKYS